MFGRKASPVDEAADAVSGLADPELLAAIVVHFILLVFLELDSDRLLAV